ncbi:Neopullulanase [Minicystis rosea]|nr:Neopullulanase [Minicystis rosea]
MGKRMFEKALHKLRAHLRLPLVAAACTGALGSGCMKFEDAEPIELGTHVDDWRDEIIYQVLVDRFANGDAGNDYRVDFSSLGHYHGGDWKGLEDKLDYIQTLGVTTIWISPVVKNVDTDAGFDGYHGYWAQDLDAPNPHFGDIPALRHMVAAAHEKKLKVILDIVTNHMGQVFYYDINMNGQPDDQVFGGGCDKWSDPSDPDNLYPDYGNPDPTCNVKDGQSGVKHVTEYDPEFSPSGLIQAYTSLGYSGPAPIVFNTDPVTNHMPPMPSVLQNPAVFNRRGRTVNYDIGDQLLHGDFPGGLKDVNTTRCDVKKAMVESYARWVEIADFDGFRIDTVKHVEPEFWRYFTQKIRQRLDKQGKKNFFIFGETFDGNDALVGSFTKGGDVPEVPVGPQAVLGAPDLAREGTCVDDDVPLNADMLDSSFYFPQYYSVIADVFRDGGGTKKIQDLWGQREQNWGLTPTKSGIGIVPAKFPVNFLDNHDVGRFLFYQFFHNDLAAVSAGQLTNQQFAELRDQKLRNALVFLFAEQGIPCIYYGDEQGFEGGNDPANREDLWDSGYVQKPTADKERGKTYGRFFEWIQKLTGLRKKYRALTHGDQSVVWSTEHTGAEGDAGIFAFERTGGDAGDAYALVVINTNRDHASSPSDNGSTMKVNVPGGTMLVDVLSDMQLSYPVGADQTLTLQVPALGAALLVPQSQVGGN